MSRRDQLIAVVVIAGLALAGFWFGLLSPKLKQSKQLNTQLAAAQAQRTQALASVAAAQAAESSYVSNVSTIDSLTPAIPASDTASSLLREIDKAARIANVDFSSIALGSSGGPAPGGAHAAAGGAGAGAGAGASGPASRFPTLPTPPVPPGYSATSTAGIPSVSYTLGFTGGYLKVQKFLAAMESFVSVRNGVIQARGRLIDVQGLSIGAPTPTSNGNVSVSVTAYLLPASDQTPLPVPRNAPTVSPSSERAAAPASGSTRPATVAASGKASS